MSEALLALLAFVVGSVAVARAVRLITSDAYPPIENLRIRWEVWHANRDTAASHRPGSLRAVAHGWGPLLTCPFCFAPYAALVDLGWALAVEPWQLTGSDPWSTEGWWWVVNVWAALSYVASMIVVRDEPPEED